jgi:tetratricopeptide (TPR) repeat protein
VILNKLASLLHEQGDFAGARPLYERALTVLEKEVLGPEHSDTAANFDDLASLLREPWLLPSHPIHAPIVLSYFSGARPIFERVLAIYEKAHGPEHPNTASILHKFASLRQEQGDFAGARRLYERTLAIWKRALGPEHRYTASILNNLADLRRAQGDLAGSRRLYERTLAIWERTLGPEHPRTNLARRNLSRLLLLMGRPTEALTRGETALTHDKVLGRDHPWTKDSARPHHCQRPRRPWLHRGGEGAARAVGGHGA